MSDEEIGKERQRGGGDKIEGERRRDKEREGEGKKGEGKRKG